MKNHWDERFDVPGYVYGTDPNAFVAVRAAIIPVGPVLCLAEGEGRNAVYLATLKPTMLLTIFNAPGAAAVARAVEDTLVRIMD